MKALLDTHVWLWSLLEPQRLRRAVREQLSDSRNCLYLSPVSVWEAMLLLERGRVEIDEEPSRWIENAIDRSPLLEAGLTFEIACASRTLAIAHQDPADRFIAATASVLGLTLITADRRLLETAGLETLRA